MKNACAYIRVSTDTQTEHSPEAQRRLIYDYCKQHEILITNDDFYEDLGISGTKADKRPRFNDMIAACKSKEHPYDLVLVWKFSRFARNQEESIVYKRLLKKCNVDVVSISEPLPEGVVGELVERIFEWMDEYYSINLSTEVKRGMTQAAMKGEYIGSIPFGYNKKKGETPVVNKKEAEIVKLIFDVFNQEGYGVATTVRYLNNNNIKTRNNIPWDSYKVKYILQNPFYIGKVRWNYRTHINQTLFNDESDWIIADGKHDPIISVEKFNETQSKLKEHLKPGTKGVKTANKHYLSGILRCYSCGGPVNYRGAWQNRTPYFVCRNHQTGSCKCSQYTKVHILEPQFLDAFKNAIDNELYKTNVKKTTDFSQEKYLQEQLKSLELKESRIKQAYRDGIDTLEEYKENKSIIMKEKEKIMSAMDGIVKPVDDQSVKAYLLSMYDLLQSDAYTQPQKNEALKKVLPKIVYDRDKQIMELHFSL